MKQVHLSEDYRKVLDYIVKYQRLRGKTSARLITQRLILAYAKQLASGMIEPLWRQNLITLINRCEDENKHGRISNRVRGANKSEKD